MPPASSLLSLDRSKPTTIQLRFPESVSPQAPNPQARREEDSEVSPRRVETSTVREPAPSGFAIYGVNVGRSVEKGCEQPTKGQHAGAWHFDEKPSRFTADH